jgi:hypothetical protein
MNIRLAQFRQEAAARRPGSIVRDGRRIYFTLADKAATVWDLLDGPKARYPHTRARLLSGLAVLEQQMGDAYAQGWNVTREDQEITQVCADTSELLQLLASASVAENLEFRTRGSEDWEDAFGHVLDQLVEHQSEPAVLAELATRLYLAAYPVVGGDVAETISRLQTAFVRIALAQQEQDASGSMQIIVPQFEKPTTITFGGTAS